MMERLCSGFRFLMNRPNAVFIIGIARIILVLHLEQSIVLIHQDVQASEIKNPE